MGLLLSLAPLGFAQSQEDVKQQSREIFKQLIEINTTDSVGNVTTAAEAMAKRLRDAGFPEQDVIVAGPNDRKKNLVARLHGTGQQKPILFLAHLDVVEARREDWTTDPFQFVEKGRLFLWPRHRGHQRRRRHSCYKFYPHEKSRSSRRTAI